MTRIGKLVRRWLEHLKHRALCPRASTQVECAPGEIYLRCDACGLRTDGIATGPVKLMRQLDGKTERPTIVHVPPAGTEAEVLPFRRRR